MSLKEQYSMIPLRDLVVFPYMIAPVYVGRKKSVEAIEVAENTDKLVFLTLQKETEMNEPGWDDLHKLGTVVRILQVLKLPDGSVKLLVEGVRKAKMSRIYEEPNCLYVDVEPVEEQDVVDSNSEALIKSLLGAFDEYVNVSGRVEPSIVSSIMEIDEPVKLSYMIASNLKVKNAQLQEILAITSINERIEAIIELIHTELELIRIDERVKEKVKSQMSKAQREYYLGEQLKAINKELGRGDDFQADTDELAEKIEKANLPEDVKEKAEHELKKLKLMPPMSSETTVVRNYLDWITSLPWGETTEDNLDISRAEEILNRDHYSLEKPKDRILEYLAVQILSKRLKGPIICFTGPPGVGKTSLARSIAESMGRKFVRMSLGGMRDEAEIRGHRRTYIGAMPGKMIQNIKKAGSMNPVFLLDEIDKIGADYRGDPSSALLEALDPEQNSSFMDHYLEVEFDLSKIFFLTTANTTDTIPKALLDRMEIIRVPGYTEKEKFRIAKEFLLPKQLEEHSVKPEQLHITDAAITDIIRYYTREAGVRGLEREIASIVRKAARRIVQKNVKKVRVNGKTVEKMLGNHRYRFDELKEDEGTGVATGLAWTPYGGDILQTEVTAYQGKGNLQITGNIGDVMNESAKTALSVIKNRADRFGIPAYKFTDFDIHLHVPEGAVPKDGPSAGITMTTALLSALGEIPVNCRIAMTGEINLRGKVLPVGGIKEKVLAAHRAGLREVILPGDNRKDLTEIPSDVKSTTRFHFVEDIDEVLETVLIK
ncbi:endopeptidase La [Limisalsivibrio acetivorans]|uniref:endopeptidase La n=1 Tax=Limisalsivibrio acetivorans TaxID=1304888 RepID=UPI0003B54B71|nr:endopeptidase La [Limisalsivibrio acetivorans]